jgi:hypothetical protein
MPSDNNILFGKIAVKKGFLTPERVKECIAEQQTSANHRYLGSICIEKGYLSPIQLSQILYHQQRNLDSAPSYSEKPKSQMILGRLILKSNLATGYDVNAALRRQAESEEQGIYRKLGELLLEQGVLGVEDLANLLDIQGKKIGRCPCTRAQYNVPSANRRKTLCPVCLKPLALVKNPKAAAAFNPDDDEILPTGSAKREEYSKHMEAEISEKDPVFEALPELRPEEPAPAAYVTQPYPEYADIPSVYSDGTQTVPPYQDGLQAEYPVADDTRQYPVEGAAQAEGYNEQYPADADCRQDATYPADGYAGQNPPETADPYAYEGQVEQYPADTECQQDATYPVDGFAGQYPPETADPYAYEGQVEQYPGDQAATYDAVQAGDAEQTAEESEFPTPEQAPAETLYEEQKTPVSACPMFNGDQKINETMEILSKTVEEAAEYKEITKEIFEQSREYCQNQAIIAFGSAYNREAEDAQNYAKTAGIFVLIASGITFALISILIWLDISKVTDYADDDMRFWLWLSLRIMPFAISIWVIGHYMKEKRNFMRIAEANRHKRNLCNAYLAAAGEMEKEERVEYLRRIIPDLSNPEKTGFITKEEEVSERHGNTMDGTLEDAIEKRNGINQKT